MQGTLLSPGDRLRDYEVIAPLTEGGMATLVLARRRGVGGFSRLVALKLVHRHLIEDSAMVQLFLDEARLSAWVNHPNVVHVEEVGLHEGAYFIAMEYVHGVSLSALLQRLSEQRRRMVPQLCVYLAAQIAEALHAAHEATNDRGQCLGIVHRDVSPQNVLLTHTGHVKLIDFGIAKSQIQGGRSGNTGRSVLGKVRYMSPEQVSMQPVDRRTDVYALGIVLWELLSNRTLFRAHRMRDHLEVRSRAIAPPSRYVEGIDARLDRVVLRALAFDPEERFDTALRFRRALLKAMPEAARLDAPRVANVLGAVVGEEMERLRRRLPGEVTRQLALEGGPDPSTQELSVAELTLVDVRAGEDREDSSNEEALDAEEAATILRANLRQLVLNTASSSTDPTHLRPDVAAPTVAPHRVTTTIRQSALSRATSLVPLGWLVTALLCTLIGVAIGRLTAPRRPSRSVTLAPVAVHASLPLPISAVPASPTVAARSEQPADAEARVGGPKPIVDEDAGPESAQPEPAAAVTPPRKVTARQRKRPAKRRRVVRRSGPGRRPSAQASKP